MFDVKNFIDIINPLTPAQNAGVDVLGICKAKNLKSNHLCFLKDSKLLMEIKSFLELKPSFDLSKLIFVIDEKFYHQKSQELSLIPTKNIFLTAQLDLAMCRLSKYFYDLKFESRQFLVDGRQTGTTQICPTARISQQVFIGENVQIGSNVQIMPGSVLMGDIKIGDNTIIQSNVTIYPDVTIGLDCLIQSGCVIGSDGFGFNFIDGKHQKIWHIGGVKIGNDVEIGANSCIDRGTFDDTVLENGCRLDNLVHIAHNCHLKKGVVICAQSGLAGSATIGNFSAMSGHVAIAPGIEIGDQVEIIGHSAVFDNIESKSRIAGSPARPMKEWLRSIMALRRLSKKG